MSKIELAIKAAIDRGARRHIRQVAAPLRREVRRLRQLVAGLRKDVTGLKATAGQGERMAGERVGRPDGAELRCHPDRERDPGEFDGRRKSGFRSRSARARSADRELGGTVDFSDFHWVAHVNTASLLSEARTWNPSRKMTL